MSNKTFTHVTAVFCTIALLFAAYMGAEAQSEDPIFEEDLICSIQSDGECWVATMNLKGELEHHLGQVAVVETLGQLIDRLPVATRDNKVHFEGGWPMGVASNDLDDLGYRLQSSTPPSLAGAVVAVLRTV